MRRTVSSVSRPVDSSIALIAQNVMHRLSNLGANMNSSFNPPRVGGWVSYNTSSKSLICSIGFDNLDERRVINSE